MRDKTAPVFPERARNARPLRIVGNNLSVVPQNYIKIYGRPGRPPLRTKYNAFTPTTPKLCARGNTKKTASVSLSSAFHPTDTTVRIGGVLCSAAFRPSQLFSEFLGCLPAVFFKHFCKIIHIVNAAMLCDGLHLQFCGAQQKGGVLHTLLRNEFRQGFPRLLFKQGRKITRVDIQQF